MFKLPKWLQLLLVIVVIGVGAFLMRPEPVRVDVGVVESRPFFEAIESQGRTRARNPYLITAPVAGRLLRTELIEGDRVRAGQVLARITPSPQDQRSVAFAQASLAAAEARRGVAQASLEETRSAYTRVSRELQRREELFRSNLTSAEETELYRQLVSAEDARVRRAEASVLAAEADIDSARASLLGATPDTASNGELVVEVKAPVDGTVYTVMEDNERVIQAGTPLLEISNQDSLEVIADLLTQDAIKVEAGDTVYLTGWGGDQTINAIVRYIEPEAFTKVSALGVEEQRVNVIADLIDPPANLGAEYRVDVAIVTWQANEALTIPSSAIFQRSNGWNTFIVDGNRVESRTLLIGARGRDYTRVIGGVAEGERVILYPSDLINDGSTVAY
jgi:HlyD family secretion protein